MRTLKEIAKEAHRRASQAMTAAGWGVFPVNLLGRHMEDQYWSDWNDAYEEALEDLEAEDENENENEKRD